MDLFSKFLAALFAAFGKKPQPTEDAPAPVPSDSFPFDEAVLARAIYVASSPKVPAAFDVARALKAACIRYGVSKPLEVAHLIAQLAHESGGFTFTKEIWNNTPAQLRYENHRLLGNTEPGDGKRFAGMFWVQLTGRWNHSAYAKYKGISINELHASYDDPATNADVSLWYVSVNRRGFLEAANRNDIEGVTRAINGGLNGFDDRKRRYAAISPILGV